MSYLVLRQVVRAGRRSADLEAPGRSVAAAARAARAARAHREAFHRSPTSTVSFPSRFTRIVFEDEVPFHLCILTPCSYFLFPGCEQSSFSGSILQSVVSGIEVNSKRWGGCTKSSAFGRIAVRLKNNPIMLKKLVRCFGFQF